MHKRNCITCVLSEMCSARNLRECVEYLAVHGEVDDDLMNEYIEEGRSQFYKEWTTYVGKYSE